MFWIFFYGFLRAIKNFVFVQWALITAICVRFDFSAYQHQLVVRRARKTAIMTVETISWPSVLSQSSRFEVYDRALLAIGSFSAYRCLTLTLNHAFLSQGLSQGVYFGVPRHLPSNSNYSL